MLDTEHSTVCPAKFLSGVHTVSLAHTHKWMHARGRVGLPNSISEYQQGDIPCAPNS
jgi:hypothetical protein